MRFYRVTVNVPVDQLTIRTFRRHWRQLIKQCLVTLFHSACQRHYGPEPTGTSPSLAPHRDEAAAVTIFAPLKEIVCEAEDRVVRAIFCDMVEAEE